MPDICVQRWHQLDLPFDRDRYRERFGNRFRRVGEYIESSLLAASGILDEGDMPDDMGVFLCSGLANLAAIVPVMGTIFHPTHPRCSPLAFASSVPNAAAFYLAQAFEIHGHNVTLSQEEIAFEAALLEAMLALQSGVCTHALVGGVDLPYDDVEAHRIRLGAQGRDIPLGSGAVFWLLGPEGPWRISEVQIGRFEPMQGIEPGATVLRGWTLADLEVPTEHRVGPTDAAAHGIASALALTRQLDGGDTDRLVHVQRHRDGTVARVELQAR